MLNICGKIAVVAVIMHCMNTGVSPVCPAAIRLRLVVPRQERPASAERSVSRPRRRRSSRTCPRRRRQRSNLAFYVLPDCHLSSADNKSVHKHNSSLVCLLPS